MALSVVALYSQLLPKTNCGECGFPTCIAFAGMVVSQKYPLKKCIYIPAPDLERAEKELESQYKEGKWTQKDMAQEALVLARERTASMAFADIAQRIGGTLKNEIIHLPYFNGSIQIHRDKITHSSGRKLSRNEQTFIHIHMAMGSDAMPTGNLKSLKEFPNTVSKVESMKAHVEIPLTQAFENKLSILEKACRDTGGQDAGRRFDSPDLAFCFQVFPRVSVTLLFWDTSEEFGAEAKLLFDDTIPGHLDIESIMFLSEHLTQTLTQWGKTAAEE